MDNFSKPDMYTVNPESFREGKRKTIEERTKDLLKEDRLRVPGFGDFSEVEKYFIFLLKNGKIKEIEFLKKYIEDNQEEIREKNRIGNDTALDAIIQDKVNLFWENGKLKVEVVKKDLTKKEQDKINKKKKEVNIQLDIIATVSGMEKGKDLFSGNAGHS